MAKPYSADLRWRVVGTIEGGTTIPEAAEQCGVSINSVVRFLKLHRETGSVDPNVLESVAQMIGNIVDFGLSS
jgi:transposase